MTPIELITQGALRAVGYGVQEVPLTPQGKLCVIFVNTIHISTSLILLRYCVFWTQYFSLQKHLVLIHPAVQPKANARIAQEDLR